MAWLRGARTIASNSSRFALETPGGSAFSWILKKMGATRHDNFEVLPRVVRFLDTHADVQELHAHPVLRRHTVPHYAE